MRVALLVTHLSGTGHLVRMLALARALAAAGAEPVAHLDAGGVELVQLPPLTVPDFDYARPRRADGAVASEADLATRREIVAARVAALAPAALVLETWPFGRRRLSGEFEAAIRAARAARPSARVVVSVRDVPEPPRKAGRIEEAAARLGAEVDLVLVHGEEEVLPLSRSWPLPAELAPRIRHTGYVGPPDRPQAARGDTVLVSAGGGETGGRLLARAADAAGHGGRPWHLLVGGEAAAERAAALRARQPGLCAEPVRADYPELLAGAAASVSRAGYNTVMDLAACRTPAVLVPFEAHGQREQAIRAEALAALPGVTVLREEELTAGALAEAAEAAARAPRRAPWPLARDGAARAARAILGRAP
jgi:predicted glycosyltransferase